MAKAINWPEAFREEILAENCEAERCAFRLGSLYYDSPYWVDGEIVDIRANQRKVRQGIVQGDLKLCTVDALNPEDLQKQKSTLQSKADVISYLQETYGQPVTGESLITVVYYKNLPVVAEEIESPN